MWQKINEALLEQLTENSTLRHNGMVFFPQNIDKENRRLQIVLETEASPDGFSPIYGNKLGTFEGNLPFDQLLKEKWEVELSAFAP